jgi:hypothetical protein
VDRTGQMYFLPDKQQQGEQAAANSGSSSASSSASASPSPSKQQQGQQGQKGGKASSIGEQLMDEEIAECPSPANSPGEQLTMF